MTTQRHKLGLVGTKFRPAGLAILAQLESPHPVLLVREPLNVHDPNAIAVYVQIGYVPANQASQVAPILDAITPSRVRKAQLIDRRSVEVLLTVPETLSVLQSEQHSDGPEMLEDD